MKSSKSRFGGPMAAAFVVVFGLWLIAGIVIYFGLGFESLADQGLFGDSFGPVNALFSGFAFAGVIVAILLQREELRLQRKELEMTRAELSRTASAQEALSSSQNIQLKRQTQIAQLSALTALLNFEMQPGVVLPALGDPHIRSGGTLGVSRGESKHDLRNEIRDILQELRRS